MRDGYGQTESTLLIGFLKIQNNVLVLWVKLFLVGVAELLMMKQSGYKCKSNIALPLDFPGLFKGYFKDEKRTKDDAHAGDYYITGDLAHIDEDGYFWFEGRRDDIIISSGYTIGPFEVEDALTNHEAVKECAVSKSQFVAILLKHLLF